MGEWSEFFEDFPEYNPANCIDTRFNPESAEAKRAHEERARAASNWAKFNAEVARIQKKQNPLSASTNATSQAENREK